MSWYRTGTVIVQSGSTSVTGTGTDWLQNALPGFAFVGPDGAQYEIATVSAAASMTLVTAYAGPSVAAGGYAIIQTQTMIAQLAQQTGALLATFNQSRDTATAAAASAAASAAILGTAASIPASAAAASAAATAAAASATAAQASADSVAIYLADMATAVIRTQTLIVTNLP